MRVHICEGADTYFKNNSSNIFSCIGVSANTGPACICAKVNSSRIVSCMYWFCAGGYVESVLTLLNVFKRGPFPLAPLLSTNEGRIPSGVEEGRNAPFRKVVATLSMCRYIYIYI